MYLNTIRNGILLFCLLLTHLTFSQDNDNSTAYSLEECVTFALQNAVAIKNAYIDMQSADASVNEIRADGLPQITGQVQFIDNYNLQKTLLPENFFDPEGSESVLVPVQLGVRFSGNVGVTLNQLIFDGTFFLGLKAAKTYKELAQKNMERSKIETVEAVTKAYYNALISEERLKLAEENYNRLDTLLRQTTAMFENGFSEKIDVDRIRVNMNNVKSQLANIEQMNQVSLILLKFQMGMKVSDPITLEGKISDVKDEFLQIDGREDINYNNRIEYSINQTQIELDKLNIKRYNVGYLPSLYAFAGIGANSGAQEISNLMNFGDYWFSNGNYGFTLSIPIFDGLRKKYQIEQARLTLLKSENNSWNIENMIETELAQAQIALESNITILNSERDNMELADEIYRVSNIKYQEGVGSSFELVDAETSLTQAQTNYYNALYNALIAKIDYLKAIGELGSE
ncbi:TolC family protein [Chondrinema litorale]|uniref:TolC family protein n=1 Tax=Chondrinema litorale TaxID=2994555 RepID=UPI00254353E2|nr:TolC family protein [Chondrinema litorale]UZR95105.1 TolC family protein [Chondrinema litorale]